MLREHDLSLRWRAASPSGHIVPLVSVGFLRSFAQVIGGPAGREGLLVGLLNGSVLTIYIDNPFPVQLLWHTAPVRCLDLSMRSPTVPRHSALRTARGRGWGKDANHAHSD